MLIVRPFAWFGRFAQQHVRAARRQRRAGRRDDRRRARASAAVRGVQSGFLRSYAALLLLGLAGLALYFLISA